LTEKAKIVGKVNKVAKGYNHASQVAEPGGGGRMRAISGPIPSGRIGSSQILYNGKAKGEELED